MRRKRNLEGRIDDCKQVLVRLEGNDFYNLAHEDRYDLIDLNQTFGNSNPLSLEIGCGKGGFALTFAQNNPNVNLIAVEKLSNVIVEACEKAIQHGTPSNLQFANCSAENLIYFLPPNSVETIYLNFSCPYPKKAYANRRLTNQKFLKLYKYLLKKDGQIIQKTDNVPFFDYSKEQFEENGFVLEYQTYDMYAGDVSNNIATEYEQKFVAQGVKINRLEASVKE
jgi:tRNA (guanine-N7-)-methyltransferase